jgi:hypothetical protein
MDESYMILKDIAGSLKGILAVLQAIERRMAPTQDPGDSPPHIENDTRPCAHCHAALSFDYPYAYCEICQEAQACPHGVLFKESCSACDALSDFAYDAWREKR